MQTTPMPDSAGDFSDWKLSDYPCRKCGVKAVRVRVWESHCGGYEDINCHCTNCGRDWWVDGCDS
jgi:hypothetical protein